MGNLLLNKAELAEFLGVSERWITEQVQEGNIPHYRIGKQKVIRFSKEQIEEYLSSREYKPETNEETE